MLSSQTCLLMTMLNSISEANFEFLGLGNAYISSRFTIDTAIFEVSEIAAPNVNQGLHKKPDVGICKGS